MPYGPDEAVLSSPEWAALPPIDPFEEFSLQWGSLGASPYPVFERLLADGPVYAGDVHDHLGVEGPIARGPSGDRPVHTVLGYEAVQACLLDPPRFSSNILAEASARYRGRNVIMTDPPEHTRLRRRLSRSFMTRDVERWRQDIIIPTALRMLERLRPTGADLHREFAFEFPYRVVHQIFGLPEEDFAEFHQLGVQTFIYKVRPEHAAYAGRRLGEMLQRAIDLRRASPGDHADDTVAQLVRPDADGEHLEDEEIISFLRLLIPAGAETTTRMIGSLLLLLLQHRDQFEVLRRDRSLIDQAIAEGLRYEPPQVLTSRIATAGTTVAGHHFGAGDAVYIALGAANRDPAAFADPQAFDITRQRPKPHVTFGFGAHLCLGRLLAKAEIAAALAIILDRMPRLRLDPDGAEPLIRGVGSRGLSQLSVVFG
jgi:cytochrome P450